MGKVYEKNKNSLAEYIADINNELLINIEKFNNIMKREKDGDNYTCCFSNSSIISVVPNYNVIVNEKSLVIHLCISESKAFLKLNDVCKSTVNSFEVTIPQNRLFIEINESEIDKYSIRFEQVEDYLNSYVKEYITNHLKLIFSGVVPTDDNWCLTTDAEIHTKMKTHMIF